MATQRKSKSLAARLASGVEKIGRFVSTMPAFPFPSGYHALMAAEATAKLKVHNERIAAEHNRRSDLHNSLAAFTPAELATARHGLKTISLHDASDEMLDQLWLSGQLTAKTFMEELDRRMPVKAGTAINTFFVIASDMDAANKVAKLVLEKRIPNCYPNMADAIRQHNAVYPSFTDKKYKVYQMVMHSNGELLAWEVHD